MNTATYLDTVHCVFLNQVTVSSLLSKFRYLYPSKYISYQHILRPLPAYIANLKARRRRTFLHVQRCWHAWNRPNGIPSLLTLQFSFRSSFFYRKFLSHFIKNDHTCVFCSVRGVCLHVTAGTVIRNFD
jgi:hypothetical protein